MGPESRGPLLGLALEHRPLNDIYWNNWRRIAGKRPARLDGPHVSAYLEHWMGLDSGPDLAGQVSALYSSRQAER
jgi:hypothetical protein